MKCVFTVPSESMSEEEMEPKTPVLSIPSSSRSKISKRRCTNTSKNALAPINGNISLFIYYEYFQKN